MQQQLDVTRQTDRQAPSGSRDSTTDPTDSRQQPWPVIYLHHVPGRHSTGGRNGVTFVSTTRGDCDLQQRWCRSCAASRQRGSFVNLQLSRSSRVSQTTFAKTSSSELRHQIAHWSRGGGPLPDGGQGGHADHRVEQRGRTNGGSEMARAAEACGGPSGQDDCPNGGAYRALIPRQTNGAMG